LPSVIVVVSTNACLPFRSNDTSNISRVRPASLGYRTLENLLIVKQHSEEYSGLESLENIFYSYDRNNHHKGFLSSLYFIKRSI
jgi:hypothetical protein